MASQMQFWGVEVKPKQACPVTVDDTIIHLSQVTLGELKKDDDTVVVHVKVGDKKLVLGMLSQKTPQLAVDLVFDENFEISHNSKNGSVHLLGYSTELGDYEEMSDIDSSDEEEDLPLPKENGKPAALVPAAAKPAAAEKAKLAKKPTEDADSDDDDSDDDDESDDEDDIDSDEEMAMGDSDEDDSDEEELEEETPVKADTGKKRPNASAKTPDSKKAKLVTPQKTDGKKGGAAHTATPHPAKKGGKTPGGDKTPKSAANGEVSCDSCKKTFKTDKALESHSKAKHAAK